MAEEARMTVAEVVANVLAGEHGDFVREAVAIVARELMEAEVSAEIGAGRGEVSIERLTDRNGYRPRGWETRVGEIELAIPASAPVRPTSPPSWSRGDARSRRSSRSCSRRTSTASRRGRSIGWSSSSASRG
jgi:Transposase, Mutator family